MRAFWELGRPVGAICHGVLVLARTHTAWRLGRYYRTYPAYVEDESYVSARWPGDAYLFAKRFRAMLEARQQG